MRVNPTYETWVFVWFTIYTHFSLLFRRVRSSEVHSQYCTIQCRREKNVLYNVAVIQHLHYHFTQKCSRYTYPAGKCSRNKFSVHEHSDCEHCQMFSVPLRSDLKSAHISVCAVWLVVYTLRNVQKNKTRLMRSFKRVLSMLIVVCVLSPAQLEHVLGFTSFRLSFGGILRGRFVPRTWFDRAPAGTVLEGTPLFRTRSAYKKWCVPRTCYGNMFQLERTENICERPG